MNKVEIDSRKQYGWIVPRSMMCCFFWIGTLLIFTGIVLIVTSKHKQNTAFLSWGSIILGLGLCLQLICTILCLHAYCVISFSSNGDGYPKHNVHPPVTTTLSNYIRFGPLSEKEKWRTDGFMQPAGDDGVRVCNHALIYKTDGDTDDIGYMEDYIGYKDDDTGYKDGYTGHKEDAGMRSCEQFGDSETVSEDGTSIGKLNNNNHCCESLSSIPYAHISQRCHVDTDHPTSNGAHTNLNTTAGTADTSNEDNVCEEDVTQCQPIYGYPLNGLRFGDDAYFQTMGTDTQNNLSQNQPTCNNSASNSFHHCLYRHMLIKQSPNLTKVLAAQKTTNATDQTMKCHLHNFDKLATQKSTSEDDENHLNRVNHPVVVFVSRLSDAERFSYYDNVQYKVIKHGYTQDYCGVHMN